MADPLVQPFPQPAHAPVHHSGCTTRPHNTSLRNPVSPHIPSPVEPPWPWQCLGELAVPLEGAVLLVRTSALGCSLCLQLWVE